MKKLLLVLALLLAELLALKLWLTPPPGRARGKAVPLVRKSPQAAPTPKRVRAVPVLSVAHHSQP